MYSDYIIGHLVIISIWISISIIVLLVLATLDTDDYVSSAYPELKGVDGHRKVKIYMNQYKRYISSHREGVERAWYEILRPVIISEDKDTAYLVDHNVSNHDSDKINDVRILLPYSLYFSDKVNYPKDDRYRKAWLMHQTNAPHHWQYWVLLEDECNPKINSLEMPKEYVLEMLCDWHSASMHYGTTANGWYQEQGDNMLLHPHTRKMVEHYLRYFL